jgi:CRP-like cAMP-binding protein
LSQPSQSYVRNCLLSALPQADYATLRPHLESVTLDKGRVLAEPGVQVDHVYFPNRGIGSIVVATADSRRVEAGMFGREGMSGAGVVLGSRQTAATTIIQVAGEGNRIDAGILQQALARSEPLRTVIHHFVLTLMTQMSFTALSNVNQSVEERLARWLLMCMDRTVGEDIPITHEFLSIMLAVQRPSVTTALHMLEGAGFIRAKRGNIHVVDRDGLIEFADGTYGVPESEYRRLVGPLD